MGLRDLHLKFKGIRLRRFLVGDGGSSNGGEQSDKERRASWMNPISHGYHVVEGRKFRIDQSVRGESDTVVVQREQIGHLEVWFYGVSDARIGSKISRYIQAHLFDRNPKVSSIRRKSKEAMTKAYLNARADLKDALKQDEQLNVGSASLLVINGEKIIIATMGDYKAISCRNGVAHQLGTRNQYYTSGSHWPRRFLKGAIRMPKVPIQACGLAKDGSNRSSKGPELVVDGERVDSETEFIILSSNGVWEVMKNQEAVNLIRHIGDPQEAAECLAREALTRMSKSNIACLVIRFD
ncbi:hypothetical protein Dimus_000976 [Dionaea muscipula]